ncbi:fibronectin type-III domain-containing protein 3A isoform X1 [Polypterus senegalus]|uniref:fibronectin type-III domain-containing protein 3A isoform X1 n=1 Tax=Polypterus senegalus TaxID=55291 RepID=UPI00196512FB|nr:fibronectin type-III domain-containing protein 3A isoform X1 [Polypterus senegalus]
MAEHTPPLETTQILNTDLPILPPPPPTMVNGDVSQQVILVQVNPGEAFTIRREDGQFQCITGPAQVPMMSPNGSVPPIYVPPGYVSQVLEENGVRRVLVLPQPEYHQSHSPLHPSPHHLTFIPHPAIIPSPPHHMYSTVTGAGDMGTQYIPQYHPGHVYGDQDTLSPHGRSAFVHRDERTSKTHERLQKKLKDRQGGQSKDKMNSPPSSPQKMHCTSPVDCQNGLGKGLSSVGSATAVIKGKQVGKVKGNPRIEMEVQELDEESKALQVLLSNISKPTVSDTQARTVVLSWSPPGTTENGDSDVANLPESLFYEVSLSNTGKDGKFKTAYSGDELSTTLEDLRPATDYHARVQAQCSCLQGIPSEPVSFTTLTCEPDIPNPPRKASGTKNSLLLQWKATCDNGSKIQNYILEWDEGKGNGEFTQCFYGPQKQYKVTKLSPATKYAFRLAAKNDMGISGFSETVDLYTSGSVPLPPAKPELLKSGVTWLTLQWKKTSGVALAEDDISYILEMEDESSGYGFKPKYDGEELSCTVKNLRRSTTYRFRVIAYNSEGKSNPSEIAEFLTSPDKPGAPSKPVLKGKIHANSFKITWDPPKDEGGAVITKYILEMAEGNDGNMWELVYSGSATEHVCERLKPGCIYKSRVYCLSEGGQSPLSETLVVQTAVLPPGSPQPPRLMGKPKARELQLRWGAPQVDGGAVATSYSVEFSPAQTEEFREVYLGSELECTVPNLLPGKTYVFRLRAANKAGFGTFSEKCEFTTAPGPPDPCKPPSVVCKSPTCAILNWEPPASNGANITEYRLEWGAAEGVMQICYTGPGLTHEMKGLLPATNYFCRVQAVNIAGAGTFSEVTVCMTPSSVPAAVSSLHVLSENEVDIPQYCPSTCLALKWEQPCDHGSEITSYSIDFGERQPVMVGRTTSHLLENLQPDTTYRIRIQALNNIGAGPFSHTIKVKTKPLPPEPPRLECTAFSHHTLKLKWGDGSTKALPTDSIQYHLQMEDKNGRFVSLYRGPCHTHKVQRLNESTSYSFCIQAFNEAGEGPFSDVYMFTTTKSPPPPLKALRIERLDDHSCEVTWEALQPMKGDPVIYSLQSAIGNTDFKQIYKGPATSFHASGLQANCEHRFRVCAIRQCQNPQGNQDLIGPYSATVILSSQKTEPPAGTHKNTVEVTRTKSTLSDEQCAAVILVLFAIISILIAFVIQYFVIK